MKRYIFILAVLLQVVFALDAKQISTKEEVDIFPIASANNGTNHRSSLSVDITGHTLSVTVENDLNIISLMVTDSNGSWVVLDNMMSSPDTSCFYISESGNYRIDIVLSNGDQYYGYFDVGF